MKSCLACLLCLAAMAAASELREVSPVTDRVLMLTFVDGRAFAPTLGNGANGRVETEALDVAKASSPQSYSVTSADDPAFAAPVAPVRVGRKTKAVDSARVEKYKAAVVLGHWVYLELPHSIRAGCSYTIAAPGLAANAEKVTLALDLRRTRSESIHVNQLGYAPAAPAKYAYLSAWMGDLGSASFDHYAARAFHVMDAETGQSVFSGRPALRRRAPGQDDNQRSDHAGADVWEMDFSTLRQPGRYVLSVEGLGCSFPFTVAEDVYRSAFVTVARALYHQRCGVELKAPFTQWGRPRCHHSDDKPVMASNCNIEDGRNAFKDLPAMATGERKPFWGGYHDAGDWDRHFGHLRVADCLLLIYELAPARFSDGELNIPESGNGVADIVDEARWVVDFFGRMQDTDGGVRGGIESSRHPVTGEASWTDSLPLFAYAKDTTTTLLFAATASRLARCLGADGAAYLDAARRAWGYALAHGAAEESRQDARAYAAAELYKTTGEAAFQDAFKTALRIPTEKTSLVKWKEYDQTWPVWTYTTTAQPSVDKALQQRLRAAALSWADKVCVSTAERRACRYGYDWFRPVRFGAATTPDTLPLIIAHHLTGDARYMAAQYTTCDYMLGGNPLNMTWVTGLGARSPRRVMQIDSWYSGQPGPVPGIVPYGPVTRSNEKWTLRGGLDTVYPKLKQWPEHELWFEMEFDPSQAEFTVHGTLAPAVAAYGYLCAGRAAKP